MEIFGGMKYTYRKELRSTPGVSKCVLSWFLKSCKFIMLEVGRKSGLVYFKGVKEVMLGSRTLQIVCYVSTYLFLRYLDICGL